MISVPNRRPPSSGNKLLILSACFCFFLLSSCSLFRKAEDEATVTREENLGAIEGRQVYDPNLGQWVVIKERPDDKMDTLQWKLVDERMRPPITSQGTGDTESEEGTYLLETEREYGSEKFTRYNVSLLLPFLADRSENVSGDIFEGSKWALHFYSGARIALDELAGMGVKLNVSVKDTRANEASLKRLLSQDPFIRQSHLIIGPYRRDNVRLLADFAKRNDIALVSPYSGTSNLSNDNPNYIMVSPTLQTHCSAIIDHVLDRYAADQVVLVCEENETQKAILNYFQNAYFAYAGSDQIPPLAQYVVSESSSSYAKLELERYLEERDTLVLIAPSWSEPFVYSLLRETDLAREEEDFIAIFGLPQWIGFEQMDYDYFEKLNVHLSSNYYLDQSSGRVRQFRKTFFDEFGTLPRMEAYLGYDVMLYFGKLLHRHGTKFQYFLEQEAEDYLHTRFAFEPMFRPGEDLLKNQVDHFENQFVHILRFQDYQFQPAR